MKSKILILSLAPVLAANAATVAYYQFDDAAAGTNASIVASDFNSPGLDGVASAAGTNTLLPKFSSATPGAIITNGVGGTVFNGTNTTSLEFINGSGGTADVGGTIGSRVTIDGSSSFQSASFTMEGFIKADTVINFSIIFSKARAGAGGDISWQLDTNNSGQLRARFDTSPDGMGLTGNNQGIISTGSIADGLWHHVALTYDSSNRAARIFMDYAQVGAGTVTNPLYLDAGDVTFGGGGGSGRAFDGLIDEARFTDSVLPSGDFLRAIPEPSSALLACGAAFLGLLRRKRH